MLVLQDSKMMDDRLLWSETSVAIWVIILVGFLADPKLAGTNLLTRYMYSIYVYTRSRVSDLCKLLLCTFRHAVLEDPSERGERSCHCLFRVRCTKAEMRKIITRCCGKSINRVKTERGGNTSFNFN